jgi:hypothetical protein
VKVTYRVLTPVRSKRTCLRKVRYGHKETAEKAVIKMQTKTGKQFDAYNCGHWSSA